MEAEGKIRLQDFRVIPNERAADEFSLPFVHSTPAYPEWPFARARHTSNELADQVSVALLRMDPQSPAARAALSAGWTAPLQYQEVRELLKELQLGPVATLAMGCRPGSFCGDYWYVCGPAGTAQ